MSYPKQIKSIYNYPESLNPFYEDEQHKRLRFWQLSKKKKNQEYQENGMGSRRGSFNLGSLKNLFTPFSSKKRSSTLSINKTSESPTREIRSDILRDLSSDQNADEEFRYSTYDPHFIRSNASNFQRDRYRSSLQNMNELSFGSRNSQLRSTVQFGGRQSNGRYGTSITPQPTARGFRQNGMTPGSSMNSVNSTNPFDDDYDTDTMTIASGSTAFGDHPRRPRKKRRAPLPPVNSPQTVSEGVELKINESEDTEKGLKELTRLTAEFESFVRSTENIIDDDETSGKTDGDVKHVEIETIKHEIVVTKPPKSPKIQLRRKPSLEMQLRKEEAAAEQDVVVVNQATAMTVEKPKKEETRIMETIEVHREPDIVKEDFVVQEKYQRPPSPVIVKVVDLKIQESVEESPAEPEVQPVVFEKCHLQARQHAEILELSPTPSREMTPDFIPVPVREKFYVPKVEENEAKKEENVLKIEETLVKDKPVDQNVLKIEEFEEKHEPVNELVVEARPAEYEPELVKLQATIREHEPVDAQSPIHETAAEDQATVHEVATVRSQEPEEAPFSEEKPETSQTPPTEPLVTVRDARESFLAVKKTNGSIQTGSRVKHGREVTPVPMPMTEIDENLKMQGFIKVANEKPIQYYEDIETVVRKKSLRISESDNDDEAPRPFERTQRRRSVKDIIESINRNQQLLGTVNRASLPNDGKPIPPSKANVLLKIQRQYENERRIESLLEDFENFDKENPRVKISREFPNHFSAGEGEQIINPVPKPRRSFPADS